MLQNKISCDIDHEASIPIRYPMPNWGADIAGTVSLELERISLGFGVNYTVKAKIDKIRNVGLVKVVIAEEIKWTVLKVFYFITSRQDIVVGNYETVYDENFRQPSTRKIIFKLKRKPLDQQQKVAAFISGLSTTDTKFTITLNRLQFNNTNQMVEIGAYLGASQVFTLGISVIVYVRDHPLFEMSYDSYYMREEVAYSLYGPISFQPHSDSNEFRIKNRNYPCLGSKCPKDGCELRQTCLSNGGFIFNSQCIYCSGVMENGKCNDQCSQNMKFVNGTCVCADGYTRNGKNCVLKDTCNLNSKYSIIAMDCVCDSGYFNDGQKCSPCPPQSISKPDQTGCICTDPQKYFNLFNKTCTRKCGADQQWKDERCVCLPNYSWYQNGCTVCPIKSRSSPDNDICICDGKFMYFKYEANSCFQCAAGQEVNQEKTGCTCNSGIIFYDGSCIPVCSKDEVLTPQKVCECKNGFTRMPDGKCQRKCLPSEIWDGKTCICASGYIKQNNNCTMCPLLSTSLSNQDKGIIFCDGFDIFNEEKAVCVRCIANSSPTADRLKCLCNRNFEFVKGSCVPKCSDKEIFNVITGLCECPAAYRRNEYEQCVYRCKQNEQWNGKDCVCRKGTVSNDNDCQRCPVGSYTNYARTRCICVNANQILDLEKFICVTCKPNSRPSSDLTRCVCFEGFTESKSQCSRHCGQSEEYDLNGRCKCIDGYQRINGTCKVICTGRNEEWSPNGCICKNGYGLRKGVCTPCPRNSDSTSSGLSCKCFTSQFSWLLQQFLCKQCPLHSRTTPSSPTNCLCQQGYRMLPEQICYPECDLNSEYNTTQQKCICKPGFRRIGKKCISFCKINQQFVKNRCICEKDFVNLKGVCRLCPQNTEGTNPERTTCICKEKNTIFNIGRFQCMPVLYSVISQDYVDFQCLPGFKRVGDICQNPCPAGASPDGDGICTCGQGLYRQDNTCKKQKNCPINSTWNSTSQSCICNNKSQYYFQNSCVPCYSTTIWNQTLSKCVCKTDTYWIEELKSCFNCSANSTYNGFDCFCDIGYFGNRQLCVACHNSCAICSGPNDNQCTKCIDINLILKDGKCLDEGQCQHAKYLGVSGCEACIDHCSLCRDGLSCESCEVGFVQIQIDNPNEKSNICIQKCGDGIRFQQECDDGNLINGDGCSNQCRVEKDWSCSSSPKMASVCKKNPQQTILFQKSEIVYKKSIYQSIEIKWLPQCLTRLNCQNCSKALYAKVISSSVPVNIIDSFMILPNSYTWNFEFNFRNEKPSTIEVLVTFVESYKKCLGEDNISELRVTLNPQFLPQFFQPVELSLFLEGSSAFKQYQKRIEQIKG